MSPADQAGLTLEMCEMMGYSFEAAHAEMVRTLAEMRADPEWRDTRERQRVDGPRAPGALSVVVEPVPG